MLLTLALLTICGPAPRQERPQPDRRALLIGIGNYGSEEGSQWEKLYGPPNDVAMVRALLVERFGFRPEQVLVLTDAEATHAGIVNAFWQHLIQASGPTTEAFFYYSGHGSTTEDLAGTEPSGLDATLVCFDSARNRAEPVPDLSDDELQSLLVALAARGARTTVITDCCHSGGLTRGDRSARALPAAAPNRSGKSFLPPELAFLEDGDPRRPEVLPWVHVVACGEDQLANERVFETADGSRQTHGLLSWYLVEALREARPGLTWEQLVEQTGAAIYEEMWNEGVAQPQRPAAAGPQQRMVFSGEFAPPLPGLPARTQSGRGFLKVQAGSLHFLEPGTRLEVKTLDGEALGFARVHRPPLSPTRCEAAWEEAPEELANGIALRVIPLDAPADAAPVAVWAPKDSVASRALAACAEAGVAEVAAEAVGAALILTERAPGQWSARDTVTQSPVFHWDAEARNAPALLAERLRAEQRYQRFLRPPEASGLGELSLSWRSVDDERLRSLEQWTGAACAAAKLSGWEGGSDQVIVRADIEAQQVVELVVRMPDEGGRGGGYLSVLCVSEDRSITPVFPTYGEQGRVLAPGKEIAIAVSVFLPPEWPADLPQRDRYVALLTSEPINLSFLQQQGGAGPTLRGGASAPWRLQLMLGQGELRGAPAAMEAGASDYSFASCDLTLTRE